MDKTVSSNCKFKETISEGCKDKVDDNTGIIDDCSYTGGRIREITAYAQFSRCIIDVGDKSFVQVRNFLEYP